MSKTTNSLLKIVSAGGGLIIDGGGKTANSLVRIATAAKQSGATVIMTNLQGKTTSTLVRIASAGSGNVIFQV